MGGFYAFTIAFMFCNRAILWFLSVGCFGLGGCMASMSLFYRAIYRAKVCFYRAIYRAKL
jgi:hypothetical protein